MNHTSVVIRCHGNGRTYHAGETLCGEYWIEAAEPGEVRAVEVSVLWYTEGKGDEDLAVHDFRRVTVDERTPADPRCPGEFSTVLPHSPLSYDGQILKLRWCVRVRAFLTRGREAMGQYAFRLGSVRSGEDRQVVSHAGPPAEPTNPFATRRVRPGAIPFLFPAGLTAEMLVERFCASGCRGGIVGPHGSGKSTLLAALADALARCGRATLLVELHDGQRRFPFERLHGAAEGQVLMVDGYEQLGLWARWRLGRHCRTQKLGLLVTTHRPVGLPTLYQTATDLALARRIVEHLLGADRDAIADPEIAAAMSRHNGDLREVLFELYDLYQSRRA